MAASGVLARICRFEAREASSEAPKRKLGRSGTWRATMYTRSPIRRVETMWPSMRALHWDTGRASAEAWKISTLVTPRSHEEGEFHAPKGEYE